MLGGLARRWYLVSVGIVASIGLAAYVFASVPVSYTAQASMVLLPSQASTALAGNNPYLNLGGMGPALDVLTRRVDADVVRLPIEERFPDATYIAYADASTSGPIIAIETTGVTEHEVLEVLDTVRGEVADSLVQMQAALDVPNKARITLADVLVDQEATVDSSTRLQSTVAVAAAGTGLSILLTGFIDGLLLARRARRERREGSGPEHSRQSPLADAPFDAPFDETFSGNLIERAPAVREAVTHPVVRAESGANTGAESVEPLAPGNRRPAGQQDAPVPSAEHHTPASTRAGIIPTPRPRTSPGSSASRKRPR